MSDACASSPTRTIVRCGSFPTSPPTSHALATPLLQAHSAHSNSKPRACCHLQGFLHQSCLSHTVCRPKVSPLPASASCSQPLLLAMPPLVPWAAPCCLQLQEVVGHKAGAHCFEPTLARRRCIPPYASVLLTQGALCAALRDYGPCTHL